MTYLDTIMPLQLLVVFLLFVVSFLTFKKLIISDLKYISLGWLFNLLYLFFYLLDNKYDKFDLLLVTSILDSVSIYFFYLASKKTIITKGRLRLMNRNEFFILIMVLCLAFKLIPYDKPTDYVPFVIVKNLPIALLDLTILYSLSNYFKSLTKEFKLHKILVFSTQVYAICQLLSIIQKDSFPLNYLNIYESIDVIGFTISFICKLSILINLFFLLSYGKEYLENKFLIEKLDLIIGRLFHEVRHQTIDLNVVINDLKNDTGKFIKN